MSVTEDIQKNSINLVKLIQTVIHHEKNVFFMSQ